MAVYVAIRGRTPDSAKAIINQFSGTELDHEWTGPGTLLRVNDANVAGNIVTDHKGVMFADRNGALGYLKTT